MRRRTVKPFALLGWTVLASSAVLGCTFLIGFDEESDGGASAAADASSVRDAGEGGTGTTSPDAKTDAAILAEPACDTAFPLAQVTGCNKFQNNGQICATNQTFGYPAGYTRTTDIVTCSNIDNVAKASCVRHCLGSGGCASLPSGFPDQCDTCQGRPNGTYCGTQMGFAKSDAPLLVTCAGNKLSTARNCDAGCAATTDTTAACN